MLLSRPGIRPGGRITFICKAQMKPPTKAKGPTPAIFTVASGLQPAWRAGFEEASTPPAMACQVWLCGSRGTVPCAEVCPVACRKACMPRCSRLGAAGKVAGVEAPCFGDFHSGRRMESYPPAGAGPGRLSITPRQALTIASSTLTAPPRIHAHLISPIGNLCIRSTSPASERRKI